MRNFALASLAAVFLAGCASMQPVNMHKVVVEGEVQTVKVQNINSFEVEIAPRRALCDVMNTAGEKTEVPCLQYRRTFERNFNTLSSGEIEGFEYETGHRYVLDVKQTSRVNEANEVVPVWSLNKIISKTAESAE